MLEPSIDVLQAIVALQRGNPGAWQRVADWLNLSFYDQISKGLSEHDDVISRWSQGKCQEMATLINLFTTAEDKLKIATTPPPEINPTQVFD